MRSFLSTMRRRALGLFAITQTERSGDPITSHYDKLERYYLNSGVYDSLAGVSDEGTQIPGLVPLRSLRNPANRVTEFYAAKLDPKEWLEAVEFGKDAETRADALTDAIRKVQTWSNWQQEGRSGARQYAWAGDLFCKVATKDDNDTGEATAVYYERIDPRFVKDFDKDERGFFTYLRVSTPKTRRVDNETEAFTQTEIWDKEKQRYFVFEHDDSFARGEGASIEELGDPILEQSLTVESSGGPDEFTGYDFIPVVHAKFRDVGKERGLPAFGHVLGVIRECDRIATRLHEMLFPDTTWVLERSGVGPDGNPLPPMELEDERGANPLDLPDGKLWARGYDRTSYASGDTINVGQDRITRLPAGGSLEPKIPNRNMQPAIDALTAQLQVLKDDLPESRYGEIPEFELSGRAIRYAYASVMDRFTEAHSNLSAAVVRLESMALTVGQVVGLEGFSAAEIGKYGESGEGFEHTYPAPDPFPNSRQDEAEADRAEAEVLTAYKLLGAEPYRRALIEAGWTEAEASAEVQPVAQAQATEAGVAGTNAALEQALGGLGGAPGTPAATPAGTQAQSQGRFQGEPGDLKRVER